MNPSILSELQKAYDDIAAASSELSAAMLEYAKREKEARSKLTSATGRLAVLVSMLGKNR